MRLILLIVLGFAAAQLEKDPTVGKDTKQICQLYNYPVETHMVTTEDGYIIKTFRITGGRNRPAGSNNGNVPVYFQHGILDSSEGWLMHGEDLSPAFWLANQGYDVWLGNNRGNKYSKEHKTLDPNKKEFWQFSFTELYHDVKANVDYIEHVTGYKKIAYVGHS